jgi:hypothetical protein
MYRTGMLHETEFKIKLFPREATVACAFVRRLVYRQEKRAPHAGLIIERNSVLKSE